MFRTDAILHFDEQVGVHTHADAQNLAASYNAGITVRYVLASHMKNKLNL